MTFRRKMVWVLHKSQKKIAFLLKGKHTIFHNIYYYREITTLTTVFINLSQYYLNSQKSNYFKNKI